jgi:hypothetical protein
MQALAEELHSELVLTSAKTNGPQTMDSALECLGECILGQ